MSRTWTLQCVASHLTHELLRRRSPQATGITIAHLDDMRNKMHRLDGMMRAHSEAGMTLDVDGPVSFPRFVHPLLKGLITIQEAPGDLEEIREMLRSLVGDMARATELLEGKE